MTVRPERDVTISARKGKMVASRYGLVVPSMGTRSIDLLLTPGRSIRGVVKHTDGSDASTVTVLVSSELTGIWVREVTSSRGEFEAIGLPPHGTLQVRLLDDPTSPTWIAADQSFIELTFTPQD